MLEQAKHQRAIGDSAFGSGLLNNSSFEKLIDLVLDAGILRKGARRFRSVPDGKRCVPRQGRPQRLGRWSAVSAHYPVPGIQKRRDLVKDWNNEEDKEKQRIDWDMGKGYK